MLRHGWQGKEDFCRSRIFYVVTESAKVRRNYVTIGNGGSRRFSVATKLSVSRQDFLCCDKLCLVEGIFWS